MFCQLSWVRLCGCGRFSVCCTCFGSLGMLKCVAWKKSSYFERRDVSERLSLLLFQRIIARVFLKGDVVIETLLGFPGTIWTLGSGCLGSTEFVIMNARTIVVKIFF